MDNPEIADRLEAFASLLELVDANPYTIRAYRRAAETIRGAAVGADGVRVAVGELEQRSECIKTIGDLGVVHERQSPGTRRVARPRGGLTARSIATILSLSIDR